MNIRLGGKYWCILKTTLVDENKRDKPEFLVHLAVGYVKAKGLQLEDNGKDLIPFIEMCGQRLKAEMVFESIDDALDRMSEMMVTITAESTNVVPPAA